MKKLQLYLFLAVLVTSSVNAQLKISVDPLTEHQTIEGFGAFGGIKAYWEEPPFYSDPFLEYFLDDLGATILRTNIFWDLEPVNDNSSPNHLDLAHFNYKEGSNLASQIPYYVALKEAGLKKLIATSWTPPDWMKLHDDPDRIPDQCYNCNNCPASDDRRKVCGGRLDPKYYSEYAEYLVAFVRILKQEAGIDLYAISIQNEPYFANPFESNVVKPEEYGVLLNVVGRKFRQEGLKTKIFGPEHMAEWSWGVQKDYVTNIFRNGDDNPYLDIYAVHGYVDGVAPDYGSAEGWTALKEHITAEYHKPLWMTETSGYSQTVKGAMDLAKSMYLALRFGNIAAWVYWSVSGEAGSEFSIMANGEPTILYHASKQFFKYIRPGAVRVDASSNDAGVLPLAFKNPSEGSMTLILINTTDQQKEISLDIPIRPEEFSAYRTSASENTADAGVVTNSTTLPAGSITTLVGYGPAAPSLDEIPDQYLYVGDDASLKIQLTGISDGGGGALKIEATSANEAVVPAPQIEYEYPSAEGFLLLTPATSAPGSAGITIKVTNENAVDESGFGFNAKEVSFSVEVLDQVTGLKKKLNPELRIYPNPATEGILVVDLADIQKRAVEVFDSSGRRMLKLNDETLPSSELRLSTREWKPGTYFIHIGKGRMKVIERVIVN